MSASLRSRRARTALGALALLALLLCGGSGCQSRASTRGVPLLEPMHRDAPRPPTRLDRAVADLTEAALGADDAGADEALARIQELHTKQHRNALDEAGLPPMKGLVPLAKDLRHSMWHDPIAYREASRKLRWDQRVDPALDARLKQAVADDPLKLANRRMFDHWETLWAKTFNAVSEPLGQSIMTGLVMAPFRMAQSITAYAVDMARLPPMSIQERQALAHRKRFVAEYPDSPMVPKVQKLIDRQQEELDEMLGEHWLDEAEEAHDYDNDQLARYYAERALFFDPAEDDIEELLDELDEEIEEREDLRRDAEHFSGPPPVELADDSLFDDPELTRFGPPPSLQGLLEDVLLSGPVETTEDRARADRIAAHARVLRKADPDGPLADEALFLQAMAQTDMGSDSAAWDQLGSLARKGPRESNMARHAGALVGDPWRNTYGNFQRQQIRVSRELWAYRLMGGFANGPRYRELPTPIAWLVDLPALAQTLIMAPVRVVFGAWTPPGRDVDRPIAIAAYRYLESDPEGERVPEVAEWLYEYEKGRENWSGALRLASLQQEMTDLERINLAEKAAERQLAMADTVARRDFRGSILRGVVRRYPDTDAGLAAGDRMREEIDEISAQRIRVTRAFLIENPRVAGQTGFGISPTLFDEDLDNGELHPNGVTLLGSRVLEFSLVAESGDDEDEPVNVRAEIEPQRLAKGVSMLDEMTLLNDQIDPDDLRDADPRRDQYLERAKLGLTEKADMRPTAKSDYVYQSLRERYGMVRGRDSVLPFDLVFRGSFADMSLGAFPRWREPRKTPDAFLYK